jgi:hypothetical protein
MVSRVFTILEVNNDHRINPRVAATRLYLEHGASRLAAEESV